MNVISSNDVVLDTFNITCSIDQLQKVMTSYNWSKVNLTKTQKSNNGSTDIRWLYHSLDTNGYDFNLQLKYNILERNEDTNPKIIYIDNLPEIYQHLMSMEDPDGVSISLYCNYMLPTILFKYDPISGTSKKLVNDEVDKYITTHSIGNGLIEGYFRIYVRKVLSLYMNDSWALEIVAIDI